MRLKKYYAASGGLTAWLNRMSQRVFIALGCACSAFPQTFLSGELKGVLPRDTYLITSDISIKPGDTLVCAAGSELLFKPNTGLQVRGVFIASGTVQEPVVMTAAQDRSVLLSGVGPPPLFPWKGIDFSASKFMSRLSYCLLSFGDTAVIIKEFLGNVDFDHVVFHKNRSMNILCSGKSIGTEDDVQYLFQKNGPDSGTMKKNAAKTRLGNAASAWEVSRKPLGQVTFSALSLAGAGMGAYGYLKAKDFHRQYERQTSDGGALRMRQWRDDKVRLMNAGVALCMVGTGMFIITILF
jgi:hypothetical protein